MFVHGILQCNVSTELFGTDIVDSFTHTAIVSLVKMFQGTIRRSFISHKRKLSVSTDVVAEEEKEYGFHWSSRPFTFEKVH